jgi:hypothetical protein
MKRGLGVVQLKNMHEITFKKAKGLPQIRKNLTMCIFMHRCTGLNVDIGALSTYAETKTSSWAQVRGTIL